MNINKTPKILHICNPNLPHQLIFPAFEPPTRKMILPVPVKVLSNSSNFPLIFISSNPLKEFIPEIVIQNPKFLLMVLNHFH